MSYREFGQSPDVIGVETYGDRVKIRHMASAQEVEIDYDVLDHITRFITIDREGLTPVDMEGTDNG